MVKRGINFQCTACSRINYISRKNPKKHPERLELKKYCGWCNLSTLHKEGKRK